MTTHEVLVAARNLIGDEKDWCGDGPGRDGTRCALIALKQSRGRLILTEDEEYRVLATAMGAKLVSEYNDTHSHAEVLAAFDKAIAATAPAPDTSFLANVRVEPVEA